MSTTTAATADRFVRNYGPEWVTGVLSDNVAQFEAGGGIVTMTAEGEHLAIIDRETFGRPMRLTVPVLCSEIIWISTEDGTIDGRCGSPVMFGEGHWTCENHSWVEEEAMRPLEARWADEAAIERREARA